MLNFWIITLILFELSVQTHFLLFHDETNIKNVGFKTLNSNKVTLEGNTNSNQQVTSNNQQNHHDFQPESDLKFDPPFIDFKRTEFGHPISQKIRIFNLNPNQTIELQSIHGTTPHFHSTFFHDKFLEPNGGNTTFTIVFLAKELGWVESQLFIYTAVGHGGVPFRVQGETVENQYGLRPIVGYKIGLNSSFVYFIEFSNRFDGKTVQITEIYSSGGGFNLELPSNGNKNEGEKSLWEIKSGQKKDIIILKYENSDTKKKGNETAYLRIKLNETNEKTGTIHEQQLILPIEIEIKSSIEVGVSLDRSIDFGMGGNEDVEPKTLDLCLKFTKKHLEVDKIESDTDFLTIFPTMEVKKNCRKIAELELDWRKAFISPKTTATIKISYKNSVKKTEIPIFWSVVEGGLIYVRKMHFFNDNSNENLKYLSLKNKFQFPIKIFDFILDEKAKLLFQVEKFNALTLRKNEEKQVLGLKLKKIRNVVDTNMFLHVLTNFTDIKVKILLFNGKLDVKFSFVPEDDGVFDLGMIETGQSKRNFRFLLINQNPVEITILKSELPQNIKLKLLDFGLFNHLNELSSKLYKTTDISDDYSKTMKPKSYHLYQLKIAESEIEKQVDFKIVFNTDYEHLTIPLKYHSVKSIDFEMEKVEFSKCFPGQICKAEISLLDQVTDFLAIAPIFNDSRISILTVDSKMEIYFDPMKNCKIPQSCFIGLELQEDNLKIADFPLNFNHDLNLINIFYQNFKNYSKTPFWFDFKIDMKSMKNFIVQSKNVHMIWPTLMMFNEENRIVKFPLSQIGQKTSQNLTIRNPTNNLNIFLQIFLEHSNFNEILEGIPENFLVNKTVTHQHFFSLENRTKIEMVLKPNESFTFQLNFQSNKIVDNFAYLIIRNNLTIFELIPLEAKSVQPIFKLGNRKPLNLPTSPPLIFEWGEKQLSTNNLTIRRSFSARNAGEIQIKLFRFWIGDEECEGWGWKIVNCPKIMILQPNQTRKIEILFTPDFTQTKIWRTLTIETDIVGMEKINYILNGVVSRRWIDRGEKMIERPKWERWLWILSVGCMWMVGGIVMGMCWLDAERIIGREKRERVLRSGNNFGGNKSSGGVLDLKMIGEQIRDEIINKNNKEKSVENEKLLKNEEKDEKITKAKEEKYVVLVPTIGKSSKKQKLAKKTSLNLDSSATNPNSNNSVSNSDKDKEKLQENKKEKPKQDDESKKKIKEAKMVETKNKENKKKIIAVQVTTPTEKEVTPSVPSPSIAISTKKQQQHQTSSSSPTVTAIVKNNYDVETKTKNSNFKDDKKLQSTNKNKDNKKGNRELGKASKLQENKKEKNQQKQSQSNVAASSSSLSKNTKDPKEMNKDNVMLNKKLTLFSDIVARSDSASTTPSPQQKQMVNKPTMYVEPYYKQQQSQSPSSTCPASSTLFSTSNSSITKLLSAQSEAAIRPNSNELGPIGSTILASATTRTRSNLELFQQEQENNFSLEDYNNSFFSNNYLIGDDYLTSTNTRVRTLPSPTISPPPQNVNYQQQQNMQYFNNLQLNNSNQRQINNSAMSFQPQQENNQIYSWNSFGYQPPTNLTSPSNYLLQQQQLEEYEEKQNEQQHQQEIRDYLWGNTSPNLIGSSILQSSPSPSSNLNVWQPWTAATQMINNAPRTPPGFNCFPSQQQQQHLQEQNRYVSTPSPTSNLSTSSAFNTSIWLQQANSPWNNSQPQQRHDED